MNWVLMSDTRHCGLLISTKSWVKSGLIPDIHWCSFEQVVNQEHVGVLRHSWKISHFVFKSIRYNKVSKIVIDPECEPITCLLEKSR